jgi:hypothetical protein
MEGFKIIDEEGYVLQEERETELFGRKVVARVTLSIICQIYILVLLGIEGM